jgi:Fic family protein
MKETEKILMEMELSRNVSLREVFEAKNLARVSEYAQKKAKEKNLDEELILLMHRMLIENINDQIAGRFRKKGEYVRVSPHIAPGPEHIARIVAQMIQDFDSDHERYFLEKIAKFHLEFEWVHPFVDGNGRMGRSIINFQLQKLDFPPVIIRDKGKQKYYQAFREYDDSKKNTKIMEQIIYLALAESLHKRIAYLSGQKVITLSDYVKKKKQKAPGVFNSAKRQKIPAFREKGIWKIGVGK